MAFLPIMHPILHRNSGTRCQVVKTEFKNFFPDPFTNNCMQNSSNSSRRSTFRFSPSKSQPVMISSLTTLCITISGVSTHVSGLWPRSDRPRSSKREERIQVCNFTFTRLRGVSFRGYEPSASDLPPLTARPKRAYRSTTDQA